MKKLISEKIPQNISFGSGKLYIETLLQYINQFCIKHRIEFEDVYLTIESDYPDEEHLEINGEKYVK